MHKHKLTRLALAAAVALSLVACEEGGGDEEDVRGGEVEEEIQDEDKPDD